MFPRWTNSVARATVVSLATGAAGVPLLLIAGVRTSWITHVGETVEQPVQFDHRHHVRDDGIGCLYCHHSAERSRFAGIPSTHVCMGCHGQIRTQSPLLEPVRASASLGEPIRWRRIHAVPDFVFFDHSSHVARGVGCPECHGDVGSMAAVHKVSTLQMRWCIDCHRKRGATTTCSGCHR